MISVKQALDHIFTLLPLMKIEEVPLEQAHNRILAKDVIAQRDQPPFCASAMDGYAVQSRNIKPNACLKVIGHSVAGMAFEGTLKTNEAVRIFTGAPVPNGADRILIQEDCIKSDNHIIIKENYDTHSYIRARGNDFQTGFTVTAPRPIDPNTISLLAAMNAATVPVYKQPKITIIATGNELVEVGSTPHDNQIISSNNYGLAAFVHTLGCRPLITPIARDSVDDLRNTLENIKNTHMIITLGGASIGDHDLVYPVAKDLGLELAFYKIAMRPGKPLMAGNLNGIPMIGLPGNPVSALVCAKIFIEPAINAMMGMAKNSAQRINAQLSSDLPENAEREHYMRAYAFYRNGILYAKPFQRQDSALLSVLTQANALIVVPPNAPKQPKNTTCQIIPLSAL